MYTLQIAHKMFFYKLPNPMTYSFFAKTYASKWLCNFHMLINSKKGANWLFWGQMGVNFDRFFLDENNPCKLL